MLLAIAISILVMIVWQKYFAPPPPKKQQPTEQTSETPFDEVSDQPLSGEPYAEQPIPIAEPVPLPEAISSEDLTRVEDVVVETETAYDRFKAGLDPEWLRSFHKLFYRVRTAMSEADAAAWHRLMGPYPGICELLRRRAGYVVLAIATSKDRRSVGKLLEAYGISDLFPEAPHFLFPIQ